MKTLLKLYYVFDGRGRYSAGGFTYVDARAWARRKADEFQEPMFIVADGEPNECVDPQPKPRKEA